MNVLVLLGIGLLAGALAARRAGTGWAPALVAGVGGALLGSFALAPLALRGPLASILTATAGAMALSHLAAALRRST